MRKAVAIGENKLTKCASKTPGPVDLAHGGIS
jgi:hypothetical protein